MTLSLVLRFAVRDWRAGELRLLFAALLLAVGAVSAVSLFVDRLQRALVAESTSPSRRRPRHRLVAGDPRTLPRAGPRRRLGAGGHPVVSVHGVGRIGQRSRRRAQPACERQGGDGRLSPARRVARGGRALRREPRHRHRAGGWRSVAGFALVSRAWNRRGRPRGRGLRRVHGNRRSRRGAGPRRRLRGNGGAAPVDARGGRAANARRPTGQPHRLPLGHRRRGRSLGGAARGHRVRPPSELPLAQHSRHRGAHPPSVGTGGELSAARRAVGGAAGRHRRGFERQPLRPPPFRPCGGAEDARRHAEGRSVGLHRRLACDRYRRRRARPRAGRSGALGHHLRAARIFCPWNCRRRGRGRCTWAWSRAASACWRSPCRRSWRCARSRRCA